jgi:D-amino-acid dehydrogenase
MGLKMLRSRQSPFGFERLFDLQLIGWLARFARTSTRAHVERSAPLLRDLNLASRRLYEELVAALGEDVGFAKRGLLMLSRTHAAHDAEASLVAHANRLGLTVKVLGPNDIHRVEPGVQTDVVGAVHFEDDAHLSPPTLMDALSKAILRKGVTIRSGVEVVSLRGNQLQLSDGRMEADEIVVAAGAWSSCLAQSLGLRLPLVSGRGFGFTATDPPERLTIPSILTEARVAVTPMPDGVRFVGTMELGQPATVPDSPRVEGMRRSIPAYYPAFTESHLEAPVWCGLRPCSPDGLPYVGRTSRANNVVFATGHAMMGMSLGPITGRLVAETVAGDTPSYPLALLSPDRYA